jgi:hypothetical protein
MKKIAVGLALCLAAACASDKKASMGDASTPNAPKAECCSEKAGCETMKECDAAKKAECQKVCPVTGKVEG